MANSGKTTKKKGSNPTAKAMMSGLVAANMGGRPIRRALLVAAMLYLALIVLDRYQRSFANKVFPPVAVFLAQISGLFPYAAIASIEYRAEGWLCREARYVELDMDRLFPMLADNKENRFHRAMYFHRRNRQVMRALDAYTVERYGMPPPLPADDRLGGVRFLSLRVPLPGNRREVKRHRPLPLAEYPDEQRKIWYYSPGTLVSNRCQEAG